MSRGEPTDEKLVQDYTSKWYHLRYSGSGFLYHARIVTAMLEGIKFRDGRHSDRVLDAGCGTGFVSQLYPNFDITGLDISDGMLSQNPYKWIKAPIEAIPFDANHFDFVIARSLLHHLDDPSVGLREMVRVLKPGGKFVCWDPNHNIVYETVRHLLQPHDRFSHLHHSFNDEQLFKLLEEAGLTITEKKYIGYIAYPFLGFPDIINFNIPIWLGRWLMKLDELIGRSWFKKLSWSLMVKAVKK